MIRYSYKYGFTLVELTLVMGAMSILLLAVLYATLQAGMLYDKGATNKAVNQMSRDVADLLRRDFMTVDPTDVKYIKTGGSGRICLGTVSYVWNTAELLDRNSASDGIHSADGKLVHFTRIIDPARYYCTNNGGYPTDIQPAAVTSNALSNSSNGRDFALYSLVFEEINHTDRQGLYSITMTLGTYEKGTTAGADDSVQCKPPTDESSNFSYCSMADVDLIVRSGGKE